LIQAAALKLRTQILLFLFLFGLAPLFAAVSINLPLVLDRVELFYHRAHLLNLRADFRDLDQHLASRHEMVRLLSKLPEPGAVLGDTEDDKDILLARARYTQWINQILQDQLDIIQILFVADDGRERFWLERDRDSHEWNPTIEAPQRPPPSFIEAGLAAERGRVLVSPISIDREAANHDPRHLLTLFMTSPILGRPAPPPESVLGAVILTLDVSGMAQAYHGTLWVRSDGSYLSSGGAGQPEAFSDFPGLQDIFAAGKLALWEGGRRQVLWVPMFVTENGDFLWVGRSVDPSPLAQFRNALTLRVLLIICALVGAIWVAARWFALRLERFGQELTDGVGRLLQNEEPVRFEWRGSSELQALGANLTRLAESHAEHTKALRAHARELERSNRYKSEFLANVSHELRTPLNSILLLSKMLAEGSTNVEQAKPSRVIHEAAKDLRSLIDNILDISRIEAGQVNLHFETVELRPLLADLLELVRPQFDDKGLRLRLEIDAEAPRSLLTDSDKVRQILKNFLSNAVKFTPGGEVCLRLEGLAEATEAPSPVRISVTDSGIGIPLGKQGLIFEAFKQVDGSTSRRYGGTGLGLAISRELATLLGGSIRLESQEGQGSTFTLRLPLEPAVSQPGEVMPSRQTATEETLEAGAPPTASFHGQGLLIVDENVRDLLTLTPLLEGWGLKVTAAAETSEALEALHDDPDCALVLVDVAIPSGKGCDTIIGIRQLEPFRDLPILAFTGLCDPQERQRLEELGVDALLAKPIDAHELKALLDRYLG